jgi:hypothetical protein
MELPDNETQSGKSGLADKLNPIDLLVGNLFK